MGVKRAASSSAPASDAGPRLSHVDESGEARMVDVGAKPEQLRIAKAEGCIALAADTIRQIEAKALRKLRHPSRSRKLKDYLE